MDPDLRRGDDFFFTFIYQIHKTAIFNINRPYLPQKFSIFAGPDAGMTGSCNIIPLFI